MKIILENDTKVNYEPFIHPMAHNSQLGTANSVWIDKNNKLLKKIFTPYEKTVSGRKTVFTNLELEQFYKNEVYWNLKLENISSPHICPIVSTAETSFEIIYKYYGPDMLLSKYHLNLPAPHDFNEQLFKIYSEYRNVGLFKFNTSLSNLCLNRENNKILAFDFKWAEERSEENLKIEIENIFKYLSNVDKNLPYILCDSLTDFSPSEIKKCISDVRVNRL